MKPRPKLRQRSISATTRRRLVAAVGALTLAGALAPVGAASAAPTYLYVRTTGCSDTGSGTATLPYCTIVKAAKVAVAGQTVVVSAGTYTGEVAPWHSGVSGSPITFRPATGAAVVISGPRHGFTISNQSWITVSGFRIQNTTSSGVYVSNAKGLTFTGNRVQTSGRRVSGASAYGMYFTAMSSSSVRNNVVTNNAGTGIFMAGASSGNQITGNEVSYNAYGYVRNAVGIDVRGPGNVIRANRVHHNEDSGIQLFKGGDRNQVVDNVVYANMGFTTTVQTNCTHPSTGNTAGCMTGDHGIDSSGAIGVTIVGNTVYGNATSGINVEGLTAGTTSGITIANNISADNGIRCPNGAGGTVKCPRTGGNIRVDTNSRLGTSVNFDLVNLSSPGALMVWGTTSYTTLAAFRTASGQEGRGLQGDPRFTNAAAGTFTLAAGSPAIDSANSGAPGQTTTDALGHPRKDDLTVRNTGIGPRAFDDRGAYERQP
ncbi:right-handed parallel beta-helix repeat-containing protein [Terrabacter sp. NPDC080008]|uniref:right-handed parallel beta-helix repeat-containing protein n=1 Tax=Terrabacter sp. NPDC080008 TaxID=3155176 RepID=UPI00344BB9FD